jgi:hypothetical protein
MPGLSIMGWDDAVPERLDRAIGYRPSRRSLRLSHTTEAIGQMIELIRRDLDDLRRDHTQLRRELAYLATTSCAIKPSPAEAQVSNPC